MLSSLPCPRATTTYLKSLQKSRPPYLSYPNLFLSFPGPSNSSSFSLTLGSQPHKQLPNRPINSLTSNRFQIHCGTSSNSYNANNKKSFRDWIEWVGEVISTAFPLWVSLGFLLGLFKPSSFSWVTPSWSIFGLTLTMLGMGMTLSLDDLRGALAMPKELISGFVLQYSVCISLLIIVYVELYHFSFLSYIYLFPNNLTKSISGNNFGYVQARVS